MRIIDSFELLLAAAAVLVYRGWAMRRSSRATNRGWPGNVTIYLSLTASGVPDEVSVGLDASAAESESEHQQGTLPKQPNANGAPAMSKPLASES